MAEACLATGVPDKVAILANDYEKWSLALVFGSK